MEGVGSLNDFDMDLWIFIVEMAQFVEMGLSTFVVLRFWYSSVFSLLFSVFLFPFLFLSIVHFGVINELRFEDKWEVKVERGKDRQFMQQVQETWNNGEQ